MTYLNALDEKLGVEAFYHNLGKNVDSPGTKVEFPSSVIDSLSVHGPQREPVHAGT